MTGGPKRAHRPDTPAEEMRTARGWLAPLQVVSHSQGLLSIRLCWASLQCEAEIQKGAFQEAPQCKH